MRGAVVGGSGAVNGGYFCRGLPTDFDSWSDLPAGRGTTCFRTSARSRPIWTSTARCTVRTGRSSSGAYPNSTAAQPLSWTAAIGLGYQWVADLNGAAPDDSALRRRRCRAAEHRRRYPGRAGRRLPAAGASDRANLTLLADTRVARIRFDQGRAVGVDCVGPDGPIRLDCRSDRVVRGGNRLCAPADVVGHRARRMSLGAAGVPVVADPAGRHSDQRSPRMGAARELAADARPATAGGGADTPRRSRDPALHSGIRRHDRRAQVTIPPIDRTSASR